tara:strand:+ start:1933 stop:2376 length:444 start_codon:yes stop_codon:yes gene_type:complete
MLPFLRNILEKNEKLTEPEKDKQLAISALLIEAAMMDGTMTDDEKTTILRLISENFSLNESESKSLFDNAQNMQEVSNQIIHFTRTIKEGYSEEERLKLVEMMWEVVLADGKETDFEKNLMRRIAGLLYIPDQKSGAARKKAIKKNN